MTPDNKHEFDCNNRKMLLCVIGLLAFIILAVLTSCTSTRLIPVERISHDTIFTKSKDSINWITKINQKDSVSIRDSVVITKDNSGNIINKEGYHYRDRFTNYKNIAEYYKEKYDSISKARIDSIPKIVQVEKKLSKWQNLKLEVGGIAIGCCSGVILVVIVYLVYKCFREKKRLLFK